MKNYEIEIRPAATVVRVRAENIAEAKRLAADLAGGDYTKAETFGYIAVMPTAQDVRRTKNLMRCL